MSSEQRRLAGRYVLEAPIGRGGMGEVWRGTDPVLGRQVAVKTIDLRSLPDESGAARFEREARATAGLSHPNVVTVHDSGVEGDTAYIVMELLPGPSLADELASGPAARRRGRRGRAARWRPPSTPRTPAGWCTATSSRATSRTPPTGGSACSTSASPSSPSPPGRRRSRPRTPSWAPPSTSRPSRRWVGGSTAAPTCTRWAACSTRCSPGSRRSRAPTPVATMMMHANDPVPDVRALRPDTPAWLADLVHGLLAKDADDRPAGAATVAAALAARESLGGAVTTVLPAAAASTTQRLDAVPPPPVAPPVRAPVPARRGAVTPDLGARRGGRRCGGPAALDPAA